MGKISEFTIGRGGNITPPVPVDKIHSLAEFDCGNAALNDWLRIRCMKGEGRSARTYVICIGTSVVGYYCLSAGGISRDDLPKKMRTNMPNPAPLTILGRLAIDRQYQRRGLGTDLLADAMRRTVRAHAEIGICAVLVHAIDDEAKAFYLQYGFQAFPPSAKSLFLPIGTMLSAAPAD